MNFGIKDDLLRQRTKNKEDMPKKPPPINIDSQPNVGPSMFPSFLNVERCVTKLPSPTFMPPVNNEKEEESVSSILFDMNPFNRIRASAKDVTLWKTFVGIMIFWPFIPIYLLIRLAKIFKLL